MAFLKWLDKLDDLIASAAIFLVIIVTCMAVFMRYAMNNPVQWVEEVLAAVFIWSIMIGAASAMKNRQHVSIDALTAVLPEKVQFAIRIFNHLLAIVVLSAFGVLGFELALRAQEKITPILSIKYTYIDIAVPLGFFWMVLHVARHLYTDLKTRGKE